MKIIYLHQYFKFPNETGGTRSYDLAKGFITKGHEVVIITSTSHKFIKSKNRWTKIEKDGLTVYYIYLHYDNKLSYYHRSSAFIKFLWFSIFKLLALKGDVVIATSTPLTIGIPALVKKWVQKTLFIFEVRDVWPEDVIAIGVVKNKTLQRILYGLESLLYKNAIAIIPLSTDMKHSIESRYPQLLNKPIEVIENISEIDRFQYGYSSKRLILKEIIGFIPRFSILYAGTFGRVNGISYVINLAEILLDIDPSIIFILIGDGAEKNTIIQLAKEKKVLDKNVFVLNSVSKSELPQLYFECSMGSSFVIDIKELWSNSANKFFDTLAAGKPILINHMGWQKDIILKKNIGFVLPSKINYEDVKDFSLYTKNEQLINEQKRNALKVAKENYALDIAVDKYNRILAKL